MSTISIIIPVKNAGAIFKETLEALFCQKNVSPFEVIIIDSGSTDGTLETCRQFPVRLLQILPTEFEHGKTRNYGASLAEGKILVFLVQDAVPVGANWLKNLIDPFGSDDRIAGVYSRNIPRPDASLRQVREIERYFRPEGRLQTSPVDHIFSNISSAIRKEIFERIPFPDVKFGEDQLWAQQVLEAGYAIQYEPASMVTHSHHDNLRDAFRRGTQEGYLARTIGQGICYLSYAMIILEALFEVTKWAIRGDLKSCWYSITMAAWHWGFRKGFVSRGAGDVEP